jgi:hypothetical protein
MVVNNNFHIVVERLLDLERTADVVELNRFATAFAIASDDIKGDPHNMAILAWIGSNRELMHTRLVDVLRWLGVSLNTD